MWLLLIFKAVITTADITIQDHYFIWQIVSLRATSGSAAFAAIPVSP
jgi:hypothetical protein